MEDPIDRLEAKFEELEAVLRELLAEIEAEEESWAT